MSDTAITMLWYTVPVVSLFIMLVALWDAGVFEKLFADQQREEDSLTPNDIGQFRWILRSSSRQVRRS